MYNFIGDNMKAKLSKIFSILSVILFIVYIIMILYDYMSYNKSDNSAPFYAFVLVRTIEFLMPSLISFVLSKVIK